MFLINFIYIYTYFYLNDSNDIFLIDEGGTVKMVIRQ